MTFIKKITLKKSLQKYSVRCKLKALGATKIKLPTMHKIQLNQTLSKLN